MDLKTLLQEKVDAHNQLNKQINEAKQELLRLQGEARAIQALLQEEEKQEEKPVKAVK